MNYAVKVYANNGVAQFFLHVHIRTRPGAGSGLFLLGAILKAAAPHNFALLLPNLVSEFRSGANCHSHRTFDSYPSFLRSAHDWLLRLWSDLDHAIFSMIARIIAHPTQNPTLMDTHFPRACGATQTHAKRSISCAPLMLALRRIVPGRDRAAYRSVVPVPP